METRYYRDKDGCNAHTVVPLENNRELDIRTRRMRSIGALVTTASVCTVKDGSKVHVMGFGTSDGDFHQRVISTSPARVTEKVVREQHIKVLAGLVLIQQAVADHYARTDSASDKTVLAVMAPATNDARGTPTQTA